MLKRIESFAAYEDEWEKLPDSAKTGAFFLSPLWQRTWWDVFGISKELHIISVYEGDKIVGVVPLMSENGKVAFVGDNDISDYLDFVMVPGSEVTVCSDFLHYLKETTWDQFDLRNLPENSSTLEIVPKLARQEGWLVERAEVEVCPYCNLPSTWDDFLATLDKKDRHELRRKMRRLEGQENVRYYSISDCTNLKQDMDDFLRLHRLSQKEKADFMTAEMERFFRLQAERFLPAGLMKLYFLEVDGVRVSSVICFVQGNEVWLYNSGFDPDYGWLSVGLLLKAYCLKDAIGEGIKRFDFLRGKEPYKYDLGAKDMPIYGLKCVRPASGA